MKTVPLDAILTQALAGEDLSPAAGVALLQAQEPEQLGAIRTVADRLRQRQAGDTVTYVVNRNLNFTNICEQHCSFCAFRRDADQPGAYWLTLETMVAKVADGVARGATEICMQGGLNPAAQVKGSSLAYYCEMVMAIKSAFPQIHLHAFSPQEVEFIARQDGLSYAEVLTQLQRVGVGSLPGTAAEVLSDRLRRIICPEKLNSATWLEIVSTAHRLGLTTTSTMLCGHIETPQEAIAHLHQLRQLQITAQAYPARITEFIALPFVGEQAPAPLRHRVGRDQPDLGATLHFMAVARIYLGNWIVNHQPSWVKLGLDGARMALDWGCNDLGGTLMEEHITSMAGAKGGTCLTVEELRGAIATAHRPGQERTTLYQRIPQPLTLA